MRLRVEPRRQGTTSRLFTAARAAVLSGIAVFFACSQEEGSRAAEQLQTLAAEPAREDKAKKAKARQPPPDRDDLQAMLEYKAKDYTRGLVADAPPIEGELTEDGRRDLLVVLKGGFCYRILGVGGPGVQDMDLFLFDPNGVQTHQDAGQDPYPVLGVQADICPAGAGRYRLQVRMYKGGGRFLVRVYRTAQ